MASAAVVNPAQVASQTLATVGADAQAGDAVATEQNDQMEQSITVKIEVPGQAKCFELQVSTGELVNDLRGYITDREVLF